MRGWSGRLPTSPEEDIAVLKSVLQTQLEMEELFVDADEDIEGRSGDAAVEVNKVKLRVSMVEEDEMPLSSGMVHSS